MRELKRLDIDKVAATGAALALVAASFMTFATLRPNRLSSGEPYGLGIAGSFAVVVWALIAFAWMPWYPVWAMAFLVVSIFVIWALTVHGRDIAAKQTR